MQVVGKQFTFEASHQIVGHPTCGRNHGHTWTVDVEVEGELDPASGMVVDFKVLGGVVKDYINRKLDHKYLNDEFTDMSVLTCETLVTRMASDLRDVISDLELFRNCRYVHLRLQEGPGGYAHATVELEGR